MHLSSELFSNWFDGPDSTFDLFIVVEGFDGFEDKGRFIEICTALEGDINVTLVVLIFYHGQAVTVELGSDGVQVHLLLNQFGNYGVFFYLEAAFFLQL